MSYDFLGFVALADPTRRRIVECIAAQPRSVAALTRMLPISQPAVSQHLKVLRQAGLVRVEPRGAANIYHLDPRGLGEMRAWLDRMWDDALSKFREEFETGEEGHQ